MSAAGHECLGLPRTQPFAFEDLNFILGIQPVQEFGVLGLQGRGDDGVEPIEEFASPFTEGPRVMGSNVADRVDD